MAEPKKVKVYVTRFALTQGIFTALAVLCPYGNDVYADTVPDKDWHSLFLSSRDYALTPAAAIAQAEKKRITKLASLKKSIAKMQQLKWEVQDDVA